MQYIHTESGYALALDHAQLLVPDPRDPKVKDGDRIQIITVSGYATAAAAGVIREALAADAHDRGRA